ncbi:hypothetical protein F4808DRAFT_455557 [Astrocystis sublimbata]|nr:hypothetical protein F4808DRAFT_455557 [Astrocystis sublimbata]
MKEIRISEMAQFDDDSDNGGGHQNPFAYVLIPILVFGVVVAVITCFRYKKKKSRLARLAADPEYQRQLEEGRAQGERGPNGVIIVGGDRAGRRGRSRRLGFGVGSREEGLNELGEAPPAYTPSAPKPPSVTGTEHVELMTYSQATAGAGMGRTPPVYSGEDPDSNLGQAAGTSSGVGDGTRLSDEMRRGNSSNATTSQSSGDTSRSNEESRREGTSNTTSGVDGNATGTSEESRGDVTNNTTTTAATTATTSGPATTTPTVDEPRPPPNAVLPSS